MTDTCLRAGPNVQLLRVLSATRQHPQKYRYFYLSREAECALHMNLPAALADRNQEDYVVAEGDLGKAADPSYTVSFRCCGPAHLPPTDILVADLSRAPFSNGVALLIDVMTALAHELTAQHAIDSAKRYRGEFAPAQKGAQNETRQGNKDRRSQTACRHKCTCI